ncbi:MAG: Crp/Fnr family transcriptional regulator [Anaerolineales bacterium]|nr:Crp/Fnr family transcriptional regulator [Anaerolineales bacterium]
MSVDIVDRIPLLLEFSEEQLETLRPIIEEVSYQEGEVIFHQGDHAKYLYFIVDGEVSIRFKPDDGPVIPVADIEGGDIFGWSSALGSQVYTSGAVCTKTGNFMRLEGERLKKICHDDPETGILILDQLAGVIAQRLRGTHQQVVELLHRGLQGESHQSQGEIQ